MRRSSARIAQLREHLRRRRHDVQARELLAVLLLTKRDQTPWEGILAALYKRSYNEESFRKWKRTMSRNLFADPNIAPNRGYVVTGFSGLSEFIPESKP